MKLFDQLKLQRLRRFEEETKLLANAGEAHLRLLESVVTNANDGVLITEAEPVGEPGPRIQYVNPAFSRMTGYSPEDVIGKTPRILQGPLTSRDSLAKIKSALREWRPIEVELINYRKDGAAFWIEVSISPIPDGRGSFTHWISVQRDISDRKANEAIVARASAAEIQNERLTREIAERKKAEADLTHLAFHDALTGLKNRAYFLDRLEESLQSCKTRNTYRCALLYFDLDGFKAINDALGHRTGDLVLIEVARRLEHCCRPQDTFCRLGGDEFTLLIDDIKQIDQAIFVAQRILDQMVAPILVVDEEITVTLSIGLCEVEPRYSQASDVLRDADIAMYRAKQQGGSRCVAFREEMHTTAMAMLRMKRQLKLALERGEFLIYYQPLIDTRTLRILAVEALVRWIHPDRGLLTPEEFIPLAEQTGLIVPLGNWVIRTACRQLKTWQDALPSLRLVLSVNTSSKQLEDADFFTNLVDAVADTEIDCRSLQIEVTESVLLQDRERMQKLFAQMRQLGMTIALDDFGTGYSSLGYLERYPIDTLKIDKSFVQRLVEGSPNASLIRMIIGLAHGLGINVSAEGVEDDYQSDTLRDFGCPVVQGFLYSKPLPQDEMTGLLRRGLTARSGDQLDPRTAYRSSS